MLGIKFGNSLSTNNKYYDNVYSLEFDGVDQYINLNSAVGRINRPQGTISAWVSLDTTSSNMVIFRAQIDSENLLNIFYHAFENKIHFTYKANNTAVTAKINVTDLEGDNKWHHVMATYSTDSNSISAFLDGANEATASISNDLSSSAFVNVRIGENTAGGAFFNGKIANVALFSTVRTVGSLYIANRQPINVTGTTGLQGYWKLNEGSGTSTVIDDSGYGNNGTMVNFDDGNWSTNVPYKAG